MPRINQHPSWTQLRFFGVVLCLMIGSVAERFGRRAGVPAVLWVWGTLALVVLVGFFSRGWVRRLSLGLGSATFPLGFVVYPVLLAVTFWGVF